MESAQKRKGTIEGISSAKRSRNGEGFSSQGGSFEDELASFEEAAAKHSTGTAKWFRPQVPKINAASDSIVFQQLEVDHYIG